MKQRKLDFKFLILLIILKAYSAVGFSQSEVFLSKPDKNIFKVIGIDQTINGPDDTARILEYNQNGLLIKESVPKYYIFIDYRYDLAGRLIEKEALYGESFANGTTFYSYHGDTLIDKSFLFMSYQKKIKLLNRKGQAIFENTFYAAGNPAESFIEHIDYDYSESGKLNMVKQEITYHDYSKEAEDYYEMDEDQIINELQLANVIRKENSYTVLKYKNDLLVSEISYNSESGQKTSDVLYKYNRDGKLLLKNEITYTYPESSKPKHKPVKVKTTIKNKYNPKGELIENKQINNKYCLTGYYKEGKLIKQTEVYDDKKSQGSVVIYQYVYFE
jgi:hypothetical protein